MLLQGSGVRENVDNNVECWDLIFDGNEYFEFMYEVKGCEPCHSFGGSPRDL